MTSELKATIRLQLLTGIQRDEDMRRRLEAQGLLHGGYHPDMELVHRKNASILLDIIDQHGWPTVDLVGDDGAYAAWLMAQHAIGDPSFMRRCCELIHKASTSGLIPSWQYAYMVDRILVFEGKPQIFGTQIRITPDGPELYEVEAPDELDTRRHMMNLSSSSEHLATFASAPTPTRDEWESFNERELQWRRQVGWIESIRTDR